MNIDARVSALETRLFVRKPRNNAKGAGMSGRRFEDKVVSAELPD